MSTATGETPVLLPIRSWSVGTGGRFPCRTAPTPGHLSIVRVVSLAECRKVFHLKHFDDRGSARPGWGNDVWCLIRIFLCAPQSP
jgi:hypothetical protein